MDQQDEIKRNRYQNIAFIVVVSLLAVSAAVTFLLK